MPPKVSVLDNGRAKLMSLLVSLRSVGVQSPLKEATVQHAIREDALAKAGGMAEHFETCSMKAMLRTPHDLSFYPYASSVSGPGCVAYGGHHACVSPSCCGRVADMGHASVRGG